MVLKEMVRLSSQHRTLYCYFILSIWIFLLIAVVYRFMGFNSQQTIFDTKPFKNFIVKDDTAKNKKLQPDCNAIEYIQRKDEGGVFDGWILQGVLLLIRHGDRGPMTHVRGINRIDCGIYNDVLLNKYKTFLANTTTGLPAGHATWTKMGPFHSFPLLPPYMKSCLLGQLTYKGIAQLLHVGEIMRQVYGHPLGLLAKPFMKVTANTSQPTFPIDEIIIYSTRYRRTFQSAMALMFGFVSVDRWLSLSIRESHSLAFCFSDCACPQADYLRNQLNKENQGLLDQHPSISSVVQWIGSSIMQNPSTQMQPLEVRDAILSILCHNAPLPCRRTWYNDEKVQNGAQSTTTADPSDFINIDQDENSIVQEKPPVISENLDVDPDVESCLDMNHVNALLSYTNWQGRKESQHRFTRQQGYLRAYGLIRNIVNFILKIISGDKVKFVLYSGHDKTMQFLTSTFGIHSQSYFIPYAARMAFEIYKSNKDAEYYFRVVYNGKDVTREIDFCEGGKSLRITKDSRGHKADLCPIENIIRFIHDDYFSTLNATNYKDACAVQKKSEF